MLSPILLTLTVTLAAPPKEARLTPQERDQTIAAVVADLRARYVDPHRAERAARRILEDQRAHRFDRFTDADAFSEALTEELRKATGDKHLGVFHSARALPPSPPPKGPPAIDGERLERMRKRAEGEAYGLRKVERLPGNVGLLSLESLPAPEIAGDAAVSAMRLLGHTDALIVDLRGNGGGFPELVSLYLGWLTPRPLHLHDLVWRDWGTHSIYTPEYLPQGRWTGKEIYVLVDRDTISAGEQMALNLREHCHAIVIGETTAGAANPAVGLAVTPHFVSSVPMGRAVDPVTGGSWEGTGVVPDRAVPPAEALKVAQHLALDALAARITDPASRAEIDRAREALR